MNNEQIKNNKVENSNINHSTSNNSNLKRSQQQGQLRKDADVHDRNRGLDSNRNNKSGLNPSRRDNTNNSLSQNNLIMNKNMPKKRLNSLKNRSGSNMSNVDRLSNAIKNTKSKRISLIPKPLEKENNKKEEIEEQENAEKQGREYNEDNVGGKATFKLDKKTKIAFAAFIFGIMGIFIFLGIIVMSAMTTTAGKIYLQSKFEADEEVTEEDLSDTYDEQDENNEG